MKVTKKDILGIRAGTSCMFQFEDYDSMKSIQSYVYQLNHSKEKPEAVKRFSTSADIKNLKLTIEAIKQ